MSALETLAEVAGGRIPAGGALFQTARLTGFGGDAYGRDAILAAFVARPFVPGPEARLLAPNGAAAIFDRDAAGEPVALFADAYGPNIARIWTLGDHTALATARARVCVPSDPDLSQSPARVRFDPADHPGLAPADAPALVALADTLADHAAASLAPDAPWFRARTSVIRAFTSEGNGVALFVIAAQASAAQRQPFAFHAAARFTSDAGRPKPITIALDRTGYAAALAQPWTPWL